MNFNHAIIGGTFDRFHVGHKALLDEAFAKAEKVSIGITTPEMYRDKSFAETIEDFITRKQSVLNYLERTHTLDRAKLLPITDIYGTTLTDQTIEAIIVSPSTAPVAEKINLERQEKKFSAMEIITVPFVLSDDGEPVSSERIRNGEIDREGRSYLKCFQEKDSYSLPDTLRKELKNPIGIVITNVSELSNIISAQSPIITVGDIVSKTLLEEGISPAIAIVDLITRRQPLEKDIENRYFSNTSASLSNPHGTINPEFAKVFQRALQEQTHPQIIKIDGEEDLLALPVMLLSPLGSIVIYGQYDLGMVVVKISEEIKEYAKKLLQQFTTSSS